VQHGRTAVVGYSALIARRLADLRGAALTRQLLAFSRRQALDPQPVDLNRALAGVEGMLRQLIGDDVEIVTRLRAARAGRPG
jgi:two-component system cell cycle sensor histidine kinase/response regulator CckA